MAGGFETVGPPVLSGAWTAADRLAHIGYTVGLMLNAMTAEENPDPPDRGDMLALLYSVCAFVAFSRDVLPAAADLGPPGEPGAVPWEPRHLAGLLDRLSREGIIGRILDHLKRKER
jgi:hypothetical protein